MNLLIGMLYTVFLKNIAENEPTFPYVLHSLTHLTDTLIAKKLFVDKI